MKFGIFLILSGVAFVLAFQLSWKAGRFHATAELLLHLTTINIQADADEKKSNVAFAVLIRGILLELNSTPKITRKLSRLDLSLTENDTFGMSERIVEILKGSGMEIEPVWMKDRASLQEFLDQIYDCPRVAPPRSKDVDKTPLKYH